MALHRGHELFNGLLFIPTLLLVPEEGRLPFGVGYLFSTFLFSPDLDLPFSKPSKRWGLARFLFAPIWFLSKHRGITHLPLFGTFLKLLYLVALFLFLYFVLLGLLSLFSLKWEGLFSFDPFKFLEELFRREESFFFVLGVATADLYHLVLDWLSSFWRRLRRPRRRKRAF